MFAKNLQKDTDSKYGMNKSHAVKIVSDLIYGGHK